jgi:hypothetical protein
MRPGDMYVHVDRAEWDAWTESPAYKEGERIHKILMRRFLREQGYGPGKPG